MTELRDENIKYQVLFHVKNDAEQHMRAFVGISGDDDLLYITETEEGYFTDICLHRRFYRIDTQEYAGYLERAKRRGKLDKAIRLGWTTWEEVERYCG